MDRRFHTPMIALLLVTVFMIPGQNAVAQRGSGRGGGFGPPQFEDLDKNGDGQVSREEYEQFHQAMRDRRPPGGGPGRGPGRERGRGADTSFFESEPQAKNQVEQEILDVLEEMDRTGRRMQSVPMDDGRFLRLLAESMDAQHIVEIGTSQGMSAIWFCLALERTGGKLTTYEIDAERADIAQGNFQRAGVEDIVTLVLGDAHEEVVKLTDSIDILFLDADKKGYIDYLNKLLPKVRPGGLVVAHNITPGMADPAYVEAITSDPELESLLVTLQAGGISVTMKKR